MFWYSSYVIIPVFEMFLQFDLLQLVALCHCTVEKMAGLSIENASWILYFHMPYQVFS